MEGFLVLLQRHLKERFSENGINFLFVIVGPKILVHGPERKALGDTDLLAEITSAEGQKEVIIHSIKASTVDQARLKGVLEEAVQPETKVIIITVE